MLRNHAKMQMEQSNEEETEVLDFNRPSFVFRPNERHDWRQQGPYLCCKSCELQHAVWIGMEKIICGLKEDGTPILKARNSIPR